MYSFPEEEPGSCAFTSCHLLQPCPALPCQVLLFVWHRASDFSHHTRHVDVQSKGDSCYRLIGRCTGATNKLVDKAVHPVRAVLMTYNPFRDAINERHTVRITLPEGRNAEQDEKMTQLAKEAKVAWEQERHRDWYAASQDGEFLLNLFRQQVAPSPPCIAGRHSRLSLLMHTNCAICHTAGL